MTLEQLNKIVSFMIGLIVVVVFLAVATGCVRWNREGLKITDSPPAKEITCSEYKQSMVADIPVRCLGYYLQQANTQK